MVSEVAREVIQSVATLGAGTAVAATLAAVILDETTVVTTMVTHVATDTTIAIVRIATNSSSV